MVIVLAHLQQVHCKGLDSSKVESRGEVQSRDSCFDEGRKAQRRQNGTTLSLGQ